MTPVIHLHVPKTGGTTVYHHLQAVYGEAFCRAPNHLPAAYDASRYACVSGHFTMGDLEAMGVAGRPVLTALRDPVDRLLSLYHYLTNPPPEAQGHRWTEDVAGMSFEAFALSERVDWPWLDNDATRRLSGLGESRDRVDDSHVNAALLNLAHFPLVGLTDRMDETLSRWSELFDWPAVQTEARYRQPGRMRQEDIDPGVLAAVRARQRHDAVLYQFVTRRDW